ncbi:glycine cleavage system H protein [Herbaspirillum sp. Sphag1AN]|uniref:glycine cleavage system protein GcvH n=1 Tax=unclassified Herbaspirillum TaxID=2624150 RepID=UPI001619C8FC|nr:MULTISPECIES: glycine cleavage system protein GcvH [unclassified Herbaspirillum]MBB3212306.1 glycine cleavage system H protein [Herbaspirillum sp. Sphag1AN]MBB3245596.1 glycine cleavage system H protein [Herbaspirillum sp. Sphag64]
MHFPAHLRYTTTHEWIRQEDDGTLTVGITDFGQDQLGPLVYVQLPTLGSVLKSGAEAGVVESNKTAADVHAPVAGTVIAINEVLGEAPEAVNENAYEQWIFRLRPTDDFDPKQLLDAKGYAALIG